MRNVISKLFRFSPLLLLFIMGIPGTAAAQPLGDVNNNGTVDIVDALMIAQYSVGMPPPGFFDNAADANADEAINIVDALVVARYSVGLIDVLPPAHGVRVDNPFEDAVWYINPLWAEKAIEGGGQAIAGYSTAIWLDSIYSITTGWGYGVRDHLKAALNQGANLITFVIYNVPNRNCWEYEPYRELFISAGDFQRYTAEFIDPITALFSDPLYAELRIVCIIEPNSLPSHITSNDDPFCNETYDEGGYVDCIQYALNSLAAIPNVYNYMDIASSAWLGWSTNFEPAVSYYTAVIQGTIKGLESIVGFATNMVQYVPLDEPFLQDPALHVGGSPVRSADFYEWNDYFGEIEYAQALYNAFLKNGFSPDIGMLISTARNGWGGPDRPAAVSTSTDVNIYVEESRIDRRYHRGNWCNQEDAGIGERPTANPELHIDAYIWGKGPGESDGRSDDGGITTGQRGFSPMCDPGGFSIYNETYGTGAIEAPRRGSWNQAHFEMLLQNAWPPL